MAEQRRHILQEFDLELQAFRGSVLAMANTTEKFVKQAVDILTKRELPEDGVVEAMEADLDDFERRIDAAGRVILLRFQPVGSDLRQVVAGMKIATDLERAGDHAESIAERAINIIGNNQWGYGELIEPLYQLVAEALRDSVHAYTEGDIGLALRTRERDSEIDKSYRRHYRETLERMKDPNQDTEQLLDVVFIMTSLERIGDYAVNIAESAYYIEKADDIRHGG